MSECLFVYNYALYTEQFTHTINVQLCTEIFLHKIVYNLLFYCYKCIESNPTNARQKLSQKLSTICLRARKFWKIFVISARRWREVNSVHCYYNSHALVFCSVQFLWSWNVGHCWGGSVFQLVAARHVLFLIWRQNKCMEDFSQRDIFVFIYFLNAYQLDSLDKFLWILFETKVQPIQQISSLKIHKNLSKLSSW